MRFLAKALFALSLLLVTPSVFAQAAGDGGDVYSMEGISDGCGSTMNADECMFGIASPNVRGRLVLLARTTKQGQSRSAITSPVIRDIAHARAVRALDGMRMATRSPIAKRAAPV
jgi:hypothetical protein